MINLFYKNYLLGTLDYKDGFYIYNSSSSEQECLKVYVGLIGYNLINSKNLKSEIIFPFFKKEFINKIFTRADILKKIGENFKNDYEILEKFCKLNIDKFSFWLK